MQEYEAKCWTSNTLNKMSKTKNIKSKDERGQSNGFITPSKSRDSDIHRLDIEESESQEMKFQANHSKQLSRKTENKLTVEPGKNETEALFTNSSAHSTGSRPPTISRSNANTSATSRTNFRETWSSIAPTLKVLSPDEINEQEMDDLEIEDFGSASGSDLTDDSDDDDDEVDDEEIAEYLNTLKLPGASNGQMSRDPSSLFQVIEPGKLDKESTISSSQAGWEQESLVNTARQISLLENEADSELDSEEEKDILKEIRNEITAQVRDEMKDELAVMKRKIEKDSGANKPVGDDDLETLEPDLKAAILKVRKLDRILAKKIKREREVKRDRILLQRKLKKELEELKPEGREEVKEAKVNTSKFLALTLPPRHNAGIKVTDDGEIEEDPSPPVTPLFTTQVPEEFEPRSKKGARHSAADTEEESRSSSRTSGVTEATSQASGSTSQTRDGGKKGKKRKKNKNFIKRNKELASDAANMIAMTEEEKARVGDLLADLDEIPEFVTEEAGASGQGMENPYQITLSANEGFHPAQDEQKRLELIDKRLQALLPKSDFDSIASTPTLPRGQSQQSLLFTRTRGNYDIDQLGERALRETKEERDLYQRLKDIEFELHHITDRYEPEPETPSLSRDTLDHLLDDCVRTMSMTNFHEPETPEPEDGSSRTESSVASRASLVSNAPRLAPDLLQSLIADARLEICGSAASNMIENDHNEGDMRVESASETPTDQHSNLNSRAGSRTPQAQLQHENQPTTHPEETPATQPLPSQPVAKKLAANNTNGHATLISNSVAANETVLNENTHSRPTTSDSRSSSRPSSSSSIVVERKPFLPQIDPSGRMSTQRQGSTESFSSKAPTATPLLAKTVWSSFSEQETDLGTSMDAELRSTESTPVPHPPTSGRRSKSKKNTLRTGSPAVK